MRYISVDKLTDGMVLGKPFYGLSGELLLQENMSLTKRLIQKLYELQYPGLYINDEFSNDIVASDIISGDLRNNTANEVKRLMLSVENGDKNTVAANVQNISKLIQRIIDQICSNGDLIVNLIDIKAFDLYTYQHSVNVSVLSCVIGAALGLSRNSLHQLTMAAVLHDLGKTFLDKELLNKPGRLTPEEYDEIKKHSELGYTYIKDNFSFQGSVSLAVLQHHERYNGTGYPLGYSGEKIPFFARIIAVADVYDAITSKRPYHDPILPSEAYEYIMGNSGQHFAPDVVERFVKRIAPFPPGMSVRLSNGLEGIVYENYSDCLTRPLIKLYPLQGSSDAEDAFIDLKNDPDALGITIQGVIN